MAIFLFSSLYLRQVPLLIFIVNRSREPGARVRKIGGTIGDLFFAGWGYVANGSTRPSSRDKLDSPRSQLRSRLMCLSMMVPLTPGLGIGSQQLAHEAPQHRPEVLKAITICTHGHIRHEESLFFHFVLGQSAQ
jgi:hypothetical protein